MDAQHSEQPAAPGELFRYTVDVATGSVTETRLSTGLDTDFPIIPPHLLTQPAKFCYVAAKSVSDGRNGIMCVQYLDTNYSYLCVMGTIPVDQCDNTTYFYSFTR